MDRLCRLVSRNDERGSALIAVLLLLMMMSALAAALAVSGHTATLVVHNHQSAAQARMSAEAGLNHGVQAAIAYIRQLDPDDVPDGLDMLLADNSLLTGIALGTQLSLSGAVDPDAAYEVRLIDEDDPARGTATLLDTDGDPTNDEDGSRVTDNNLSVLIVSTGYARNNTSVTLEATLSPYDFPAVVTNAGLTISGNPTIDGTSGSVHSNADVTISGNPFIAENATASGTLSTCGHPTVGGLAMGGVASIPIPEVRASEYRSKADFVLTNTGRMTLPDGVTVLCDEEANPNSCKTTYGWEFNAQGWRIGGNTASDGTFYVEAPARISGNPGDDADPLRITIIAEGSIEISGNPDLTPDTTGVLFVTHRDLKIAGNLEMASGSAAQILVHEQVSISGNPEIAGQLIVENATSTDTLVEHNTISGNATITYNGGLGTNLFRVTGWREVR